MPSIKNDLGLAMIAKKIVFGEQIIDAIRSQEAKLVLVASDASKNTKKKLFNKAAYYQVECLEVFDIDFLSKAVNKNNRVALAIIDDGFATMIKKKVKEE